MKTPHVTRNPFKDLCDFCGQRPGATALARYDNSAAVPVSYVVFVCHECRTTLLDQLLSMEADDDKQTA